MDTLCKSERAVKTSQMTMRKTVAWRIARTAPTPARGASASRLSGRHRSLPGDERLRKGGQK
ncbi:hypothetical protein HaLaN_03472 [Haematococcus lacustris]|uniref:Uncharacterized protein n=1 Tax=Haematococcus lacustris TaxID=44745 RepID=A0A699YQP9_HAELA|nr:hypothetical protein HaLaN_03472 [Haematococcus lacustris]